MYLDYWQLYGTQSSNLVVSVIMTWKAVNLLTMALLKQSLKLMPWSIVWERNTSATFSRKVIKFN